MKYQIIEKEIYSEADLLHFGGNVIFGDIVNHHFPDYSGIPLGDPIFESENLQEVKVKKDQLEIQRLKTLNEMITPFFNDDNFAEDFFSSEKFSQLKDFYQKEFSLEIIRQSHNIMEVGGGEFHFPTNATDEQILQIQELLGLYFFKIKEKEES